MRRAVFAVLLLMLLSPMMISANELEQTTRQDNSIQGSLESIESVDLGAANVVGRDRSSVRGQAVSSPLAAGGGSNVVDRALTRVRLRLDSTSSSAKLDLIGATITEHRVVTASPASAVEISKSGIKILGRGVAEILAVLRVPDPASPRVGVKKNPAGAATAWLYRANDTETLVTEIRNTSSEGTDAYRSLARGDLVGAGLQIPRLDSRRLTLAYYYAWYNQSSFNKGLWWEKPAGPYDTTDPSSVRAMVSQAATHGINGFIFSWGNGEHSEARLQLLLQAARAQGNFVVAAAVPLMHDSYGTDAKNPALVAASIRRVLKYASDSTFLKVGGRPVVFLYGSRRLEPAQWRSVRSTLKAYGLDPFLMGDASDEDMPFDGMYLYNPNSMNEDALTRKYRKIMEKHRVPWALDSSYKRRLWAASVSPGYDDTYNRPMNPTRRPRDNGARFDQTWRAALSSLPEWVLITSYNEWFEATHIAPGTRTGYRALQQAKSWSTAFARS